MDISIEQSVVGSILIDERVMGYVFMNTTADDFTVPALKKIYSTARALYSSGEKADPAIIANSLGSEYRQTIIEAMKMTPTAANIEAYVEALQDARKLRNMQGLAMQVLHAQTSSDAAELLSSIDAVIADRPGIAPVSFAQGMKELAEWVRDPTPPQYLDWGIEAVNARVAVEAGDFVVIGADSSTGKTALALQLAGNLAMRKKRVGFFSLETNTRKIYQRIAAQLANVNFQDVKYKRKADENALAIDQVFKRIGALPLDVLNLPGATVPEIKAITMAKHYDVIFIDYIQLMNDDAKDRYDKVTNISMGLHTMAQQLSVTVVGLSQVTVQTDGKKMAVKSTKDDLRDSRQLKQDADVIFMMSKVAEEDNRRWFVIDKNKDGALGKLCLKFDYTKMLFEPCDAPGDTPYDRVRKACAEAKRERRELQQVSFHDLDDDGEALPF